MYEIGQIITLLARVPETTYYIYGLIDCRHPKRIMYVGQTNNPKLRLRQHVQNSSMVRLNNWIKQVDSNNGFVQMVILGVVSADEANDAEQEAIKRHRAINPDLLNKFDLQMQRQPCAPGFKHCLHCSEIKPSSCFSQYASYCSPCASRVVDNARYKKRVSEGLPINRKRGRP